MNRISLIAFVAALSLSAPVTAEAVTTLTFETVPAPFTSYFESGATVTALGPLQIFAPGGPNGTRSLISSTDEEPFLAYPFRADFDVPAWTVSVDLGDFGDDADQLFLNAYNSSNVLIASAGQLLGAGVSGMVTLNVATAGIAYVTFGAVGDGGSSVYADNLSFDVPEPASAAVLGLGVLGLAARRRLRGR
jgi:hypothetical protein